MNATTVHFDVGEIKHAAAGRWPEILSQTCHIDREFLDGRHHPCPKCGGVDRFRMMDEQAGALICGQCFNTNNGDGLAAVRWARNCDFTEALAIVGDYVGIGPESTNGHATNAAAIGIVERVAIAKRVSVESLEAYGAEPAMRGRLEVCRIPTYDETGEASSYFDLTADVNDKGLNEKGGKAGMFFPSGRLPQPGETWIICEGPKDPCAYHAMGYLAAGMPTSKLNAKFARLFKGCHVIFAHDLDVPAVDGSKQSAARLFGGAASVRIARLPGEIKPDHGDDVRDVLKQRDGEALVRQAIADAVEWEPARSEESDDEANDLPTLAQREGRTELANARRLVKLHGDDIRWCDPWGKWIIWDGTRWKVDDTCRIDAVAKDVPRELWPQLAEAALKVDSKTVDAMARFAKSSAQANGLRNMVSLARSEPGVPILPDTLDTQPWLLNVENGTLDLKTGELQPHSRDDLITKLAPVVYEPDADCRLWLEFLNTIMAGNEDLIGFLRRAIGMSITGAIGEHVLMFLYGSGANGKSTFLNTTQSLLGPDYSMKAPPDLLMVRQGESHPTERADLYGKRLVSCIEAEDGRRLAESLVKELTGGDRVRARRMREDFWEFDPTHHIWLAANHKPPIRGTDQGMWRRIKLVPFTVTIPPEQQDTQLPERLLDELSGILNWALLGVIEWQADGLGEPQAVKDATKEYREQMDLIGNFLEERCLVAENAEVGSGGLYKAYRGWCEQNGEHPAKQRDFGMRLTERGFATRRATGGKRMRSGVILRDQEGTQQGVFDE